MRPIFATWREIGNNRRIGSFVVCFKKHLGIVETGNLSMCRTTIAMSFKFLHNAQVLCLRNPIVVNHEVAV